MTNPFKKIAPALLVRGTAFSIIGLVLLASAVPTFLSVERNLDLPGGVIGIFLLTVGVIDLVHAVQWLTRLRKERLDFSSIDYVYSPGSGGVEIPRSLMASDDNPNEAGQATLIEWIARVFPKVAYVPRPYTGALHSVLIAFSLGVLGMLILLLLRIVLAGPTDQQQLSNILDWYQWLYLILGLGFWAVVSRFGFRRALVFSTQLMPRKIVGLFVVLLALAVGLALSMASETELLAPPDLGPLPTILWAGAFLVIAATCAIIFVRSKRAPERYSVFRGEEFFTVGMHPTDMINVIKSYTGRLGEGAYSHLGSWKPEFEEHTAVQAGEFEANLNAESSILLQSDGPASLETHLGTALVWLGILLTTLAGLLLWQAVDNPWDTAPAMLISLRTPVTLTVFGALLFRLGIIPVAEIAWTSVLTYCHITGTFQAQGGMALMQAGDHSIKGSVLTTATVQPKCAYLTSVGFLQPGLSKHAVPRLIDRVEPASQIANELLAAIRNQATQMSAAGAPVMATQQALPDQRVDDGE